MRHHFCPPRSQSRRIAAGFCNPLQAQGRRTGSFLWLMFAHICPSTSFLFLHRRKDGALQHDFSIFLRLMYAHICPSMSFLFLHRRKNGTYCLILSNFGVLCGLYILHLCRSGSHRVKGLAYRPWLMLAHIYPSTSILFLPRCTHVHPGRS